MSMASLSESAIIYGTNTPDDENKKWYNTVYLCVEKEGYSEKINGFNCYYFTNYNSATNYFQKNQLKYNYNKNIRHTIVPVCKWVPNIFHKTYLNYKLKQIYWKNNITLFRYVFQNK
jgi:hypothetical protein